MAICPFLTLLNQGHSNVPVDSRSHESFIDCQEGKCQWYIKKIGGGIEVYDCAISALALYAIRDLTQK